MQERGLLHDSERVPCDLNETVRQLAKDVRSLDRAIMQTRLAPKALVLAHPVALRRILENLFSNRIRAERDTQPWNIMLDSD